jgi:hypothetical protein
VDPPRRKKTLRLRFGIVYREIVVVGRVNTEDEADIRNRYLADPSITLSVGTEPSRSAETQTHKGHKDLNTTPIFSVVVIRVD